VLKRHWRSKRYEPRGREFDGHASYLNVLAAQTDLNDAQLTLVTARLQRLTNLIDPYRTPGGGWIERSGEEPRPVTG
jgi:outer membrane protein, multidrug efflux system